MATYIPPKRGVEYIFYISLVQQADTKLLQAAPTLAAGDFTISKDGGSFANLNTLPTVTPAAGYAVKILLSGTEMTADNVLVVCHDASGAQWCDVAINIQTSANQIDELATPAQVNEQVLDVLNTDTFAEPGQEDPVATNTLVKKIGYLFKFLRNRITTSTSQISVYADNGTTLDQKSTISDNGTIFERGEFGTGA